MNTPRLGEADVRAAYAAVRHLLNHPQPPQDAVVVLHLGDEALTLAWGTGAQPLQVAELPLGLRVLSERFFPAGRLDERRIENAIEQVEDTVMPWHARLPVGAHLFAQGFAQGAAITQLALWADAPWADSRHPAEPWLLTTEAVEDLFNRWVALAQGRPARQDLLPTDGPFSAALLVLREFLHHLGFRGITILPPAPESAHQPLSSRI